MAARSSTKRPWRRAIPPIRSATRSSTANSCCSRSPCWDGVRMKCSRSCAASSASTTSAPGCALHSSRKNMDFAITSDQQALLDMAADFARNEIAPHVEEFERNERFPRELAVRMGEVGLLGGTIPEEYGGLGLDHVTLALLLEELAYFDVTAAVIAGWPSCSLGRPILLYGTEEQKRRYLTPLCQGKIFGAAAVTEPHSG